MSKVLIESLLAALNKTQRGTYTLRSTPTHTGRVMELCRYTNAADTPETVFTASSAVGFIAMAKVYLQGIHHGSK